MAVPGRTGRRQDARRRGMGEGMALGARNLRCARRRIALVGETAADVRDVMVEGVSGILAVHTATNVRAGRRRRAAHWSNGVVAQLFSADDPESLRGPQFAAAWCDELAKWRYAEGDVGHAAIWSAARRLAAPARNDDAAPAALAQTVDERSGARRDASGDAPRTPPIWRRRFWKACLRICRHASGPSGTRRRDCRRTRRRPVDARRCWSRRVSRKRRR